MTGMIGVPSVEVLRESRPLMPSVANALVNLRVQQRLSYPTLCELVFADPQAAAELPIGSAISVSLGPARDGLFDGRVTAVSHEHTSDQEVIVKIRAYDRLHELRTRQCVRDFVSLSSREVFSKIAAEVGLSVRLDTTGPLWPRLVQLKQSDFDFLHQIAQRSGLHFFLQGSTLVFITLAGEGPAIPLVFGASLLDVRFEANASAACSSVEVNAWDPWLAALHTAKAATPRTGGENAGRFDLGDTALRRFGVAVQSAEQARALAQSELDRRGANAIAIQGTAEGQIGLRPGCRIETRGVSSRFDGTYVLTSVTHTLDATAGYLTAFDSALPASGTLPEAADVTIAEVIRVDDPKSLGRIRARLSCFADLETDWLEVLLPAAGRDKGLVAIPDVGDTVLVLLVGRDPTQGIVLGGLFGSTAPKDTGVAGNSVKRLLLRTPGGQQLTLEDGTDRIRLEHSNGARIELTAEATRIQGADGSFVELTGSGSTLHSAGDLTIRAPGKRITIAAAAIDFEEA
jgi:phage protein D/phage baseplate assembly protein gpV